MNIAEQIQALSARLEECASRYGNKSFVRPVQAIVDEIESELIDVPGWLYVLWSIAARKAQGAFPEGHGRQTFIFEMNHRMHRNDRGPVTVAPGKSLEQLLVDIQVLAMDAFAMGEELRRRLIPIARAIEVAHVTDNTPRWRRGSVRDPRSDD